MVPFAKYNAAQAESDTLGSSRERKENGEL